ncbi:MAG: hypothetical protein K2N88_06845, partial [Muribaculaceae bacterium]|nr:hypothetical protein [Muribaculaceae bacterium]
TPSTPTREPDVYVRTARTQGESTVFGSTESLVRQSDILTGATTGHTNWAAIPVTKKLVTGTITADTALRLAGNIPVGESLHCIIQNNSSKSVTLSLAAYPIRNVDSLVLLAGQRAEVNFVYDGVNYFVRAMK